MIKINTYIVKPLSSKKENIFLILAFFILISLAAIALKIIHRTDYEITLKDENNSLPSLKVLAEEEIPPYFKDVTWEERGAVEWTTFKHDNEDYFIGRGNGKVGTFVVKFNNENIDESDIFYMKETPSFEDIEKNFEKYEHILKKIVPYTGNDERKKFTGE